MTQKAVIYCRVSSRSQETEGHGLESQETRCRQHAEAKGYEVAAVFPDTISGGGDFMQRPGMLALLSFLDAQPNERFVVIFDDLKRFARDTRFHLDLRDAFRRRDATIECLNFKFDDSPEGEFIETIMAAQGALERKQNGRQVAQKMKARMQSGYWIHNPPIGYRYETIRGRGKMLVANPPFDCIIREAFEGYASGRFATQAEVKRFFESFPNFPRNKHGEIKQQRVSDILAQPIYAGYICSDTYGIHWLKAQHSPLISLETYEKVQERKQGSRYAPQRKNIGNDFALRGIACCADCNTPLRSSWSKGKYKHYAYYLCQTKDCASYGKSIPREKAEGEVGAIIKSLQPSKGLVALVRAMFRSAWDARRAQASAIRKEGQAQLRDIDKKMETLLTRSLETDNAAMISMCEAKLTELQKQKAILTEQLAKQVEPKRAFDEKLELSLKFLSSPWKLWESGDITLRRLVLKLAFTDHVQYCRNEGARTPERAFPFKALGALRKLNLNLNNGAVEKTRTSTPVKEQRPQRCASTNSATTALS